MAITIKTKYIIIAIIIALAGIFLLGGYVAHRRADNRYKTLISALNDTIRTYKYTIGDLEKTAVEKNQIIVSQNEAYKTLLIEKEEQRKLNLKKVTEVTSLKGEIRILKDSLAHTGNVIIVTPCDSTEKPRPAIELPFTFSQQDKYLNLKGGFDVKGKMNIDLKVPLAVDVWSGVDRKTKQYKAVLTYDNPYLMDIDITSVKIDIPKPFYDKLWFRATTLGVAFVGGMFAVK